MPFPYNNLHISLIVIIFAAIKQPPIEIESVFIGIMFQLNKLKFL